MIYIDFSRCQITTPETVISRGRVLFKDGKAAVWVEDKTARTATRVLYATGATFTKSARGRDPHVIELEGGETWTIRQYSGGCGCGSRLKPYSVDQLLAEDFTHIG